MVAHPEACQLYIAQEIDEGIAQGKSAYQIGKEVSVWVARVFEVKIPTNTIRMRAQRAKNKLQGEKKPAEKKSPVDMAIFHLSKISFGDPDFETELTRVLDWINKQIEEKKTLGTIVPSSVTPTPTP